MLVILIILTSIVTFLSLVNLLATARLRTLIGQVGPGVVEASREAASKEYEKIRKRIERTVPDGAVAPLKQPTVWAEGAPWVDQ